MQRFIDQHGLGNPRAPLAPDSAQRLALAAFDVLLLTSQWEGTPNVAIEAQAVGTPVVLTGGGGASEALAAARTGLFVERAEAGPWQKPFSGSSPTTASA
jgi:glycosyltransferase involved in cell wall biosynthesis